MNFLDNLEKYFLKNGFNIFRPMNLDWYQENINEEGKFHQLSRSNQLGVLIGHNKEFWPTFIHFIKQNNEWLSKKNPIDDYSKYVATKAKAIIDKPFQIRFSHLPEPNHLSFPKLAHYSGLAHLTPTHISFHPKYGPWFSLRFLLIFDLEYNGDSHEISHPCEHCQTHCEKKFHLALLENHQKITIKDNWQSWLKVRQSCPVGKEFEYSTEQSKYHYTSDKSVLEKLVFNSKN